MATSLKKCRDQNARLGFWVITLSIFILFLGAYVLSLEDKLKQSSKENAELTKKVHELTAIDTTSMPAGKLVITPNDSMYTTNIGWKAIRVNPEEMLKLQIQETDKKMERLMQTVRELENLYKPKPKITFSTDSVMTLGKGGKWITTPDTPGRIQSYIIGLDTGGLYIRDSIIIHN